MRALLAERLRDKARDLREPISGRLYRHPAHRWLADLEDGRAVDVWPWLLRGIVDAPPGARLVRVDVDGVVTATPYEPTRPRGVPPRDR